MTVKNKDRLDVILVERGFLRTRSRARDAIKQGHVLVDGIPVLKPGQLISGAATLTLSSADGDYVSRGAVKLAAALDAFSLQPQNRTCLDIGASTGGFTQILLERGAAHVVAVDVGHDQLHADIKNDKRVTNLEGTDARDLTQEQLNVPIQAITADVSFISLTKALSVPLSLAADGAWLAALIKPQFEVGRDAVGKGGIVKSQEARQAAIDTVCSWIGDHQGWRVLGTISSPITGQTGNQEYLVGAVYEPSKRST